MLFAFEYLGDTVEITQLMIIRLILLWSECEHTLSFLRHSQYTEAFLQPIMSNFANVACKCEKNVHSGTAWCHVLQT
jgi:hypothetical protein